MGVKSIIGLLRDLFMAEATKSAVTAPVETFDAGKMGGEQCLEAEKYLYCCCC